MCIFAQKCIIVKKKFNMKKKLVFATNNAHKLEEIRAILGDKVEVLSLKDIRCEADIPETADTLEGNAALKAEYIHAHYGMDCFADDTGLEVEALDGAPGVYSARYAGGEGHDSEANMKKLLAELKTKKKYELVRDLFVFCCFTGLSWTDMRNLTKSNIQTSFDGHVWIKTSRQKTGVESDIRLLEVAKHIIDKYEGLAKDDRLLPVPAYSVCKYDIKQVAKQCGIEKNVSWHVARHSFATSVCLSNGVPIETLSKMMGHTSIRSTQIYAKITAQKLSDDMEKLSQRIQSVENIICQTI